MKCEKHGEQATICRFCDAETIAEERAWRELHDRELREAVGESRFREIKRRWRTQNPKGASR